MNIILPRDSEAALGKNAVLGENRSWLLTRAVSPDASISSGMALANRMGKLAPHRVFYDNWRNFVALDLKAHPGQVLFGRLKSRLVIEGAPVPRSVPIASLDRLSGLPRIPGSAVKGCARQAALLDLRGKTAIQDKVETLVRLALVFGWKSSDWRSGDQTDAISPPQHGRWGCFAQACGTGYANVLDESRRAIWDNLNRGRPYARERWPSQLQDYGGGVQFLESFPWQPRTPDLELDVTANHHANYYSQRSGYELAPDIEPASVRSFLAIAPDQVFAFVILGEASLAGAAQDWLRQGLSEIGLGARKSAGYGWFDTGEELQKEYRGELRTTQEACRQEHDRMEAETKERQRRAAVHMAAVEKAERMQSLSDEELLDFELLQLREVQFWGKLQKFNSLDEDSKKAVVRVLQNQRVALWQELKQRAARGGHWSRIENQIRQFSRENEQGKMP